MSSPRRQPAGGARFDVMFWLPPGGVANGVRADAWAELADLGDEDITPVLRLLADAHVGGYVATPGGQAQRRGQRPVHRLWVDSLRYRAAEDLLMAYLHDRRPRDERGG